MTHKDYEKALVMLEKLDSVPPYSLEYNNLVLLSRLVEIYEAENFGSVAQLVEHPPV
jgi:hypothetical protein